jgi:NADP-dependent 3-hydroxy acid dehydrogenase YdfG
MKESKVIIASISSDIGNALGRYWKEQGRQVYGTYRKKNLQTEELEKKYRIPLVQCDFLDKTSIEDACLNLRKLCLQWDVLVIAPGTLEPIGKFEEINFDEWENCLKINFINCMRMLHLLLPYRACKVKQNMPCVLFFAGGGTNDAPVEHSSYILSKIALIKSCELLDAEIPDVKFMIVGPGWVKTKIHQESLRKGQGISYNRTKVQFEKGSFIPMEKVVACFDWLIKSSSRGISGRNFSVVFDSWGTRTLEQELEKDLNMYKLRRYRND